MRDCRLRDREIGITESEIMRSQNNTGFTIYELRLMILEGRRFERLESKV